MGEGGREIEGRRERGEEWGREEGRVGEGGRERGWESEGVREGEEGIQETSFRFLYRKCSLVQEHTCTHT